MAPSLLFNAAWPLYCGADEPCDACGVQTLMSEEAFFTEAHKFHTIVIDEGGNPTQSISLQLPKLTTTLFDTSACSR